MSVEQNKMLTRSWYMEVWNRDDQARIPEFIAADCVHHRGTDVVPQGPAEWVKAFQRWRSAFPDLRSEIDLLVAEEDTVAAYYRFGGTHTGTFVMMGGLTVPPTGRPFTASEVVIFRFVDGKVVESWAVWDQLALLQQLGSMDLAAEFERAR